MLADVVPSLGHSIARHEHLSNVRPGRLLMHVLMTSAPSICFERVLYRLLWNLLVLNDVACNELEVKSVCCKQNSR